VHWDHGFAPGTQRRVGDELRKTTGLHVTYPTGSAASSRVQLRTSPAFQDPSALPSSLLKPSLRPVCPSHGGSAGHVRARACQLARLMHRLQYESIPTDAASVSKFSVSVPNEKPRGGLSATFGAAGDSTKSRCSFVLSSVLSLVFAFIVMVAVSRGLYGSYTCNMVPSKVRLFQTSKEGPDSLSEKPDILLVGGRNCNIESSVPRTVSVKVNLGERYQSIMGFGGAFTEATALNFAKLSKENQQRVIDTYWGEDGIGYTMGRVPINSCDFSVESYSFDDTKDDWELEFFDMDLRHDEEAIIPLIRRANAAVHTSSGRPMRLLASPWSPPAWLKQPVNGTQSMVGSHQPDGLLEDTRAHATWAKCISGARVALTEKAHALTRLPGAGLEPQLHFPLFMCLWRHRYLSRWITAYEQHGVSIWGLTVQNEPEFAAPWEACKFNASSQASFIADFLGPQMRAEHPDVKVMAFDHNKDHVEAWSQEMFSGLAGGFVDGIAFHWYAGGMNRLLDGTYGYQNLAATQNSLPKDRDVFLLASEGCNCPGTAKLGSETGWVRAERYAHDILNDLNNYAAGWVDWNLLLDHRGGPNHLSNFCDAPMVCTPDFSGVVFQPYLPAIGHFAKFFTPGSVRVGVELHTNLQGVEAGPSGISAGHEVTLWPCDQSVRQAFAMTNEGYLAMRDEDGSSLCVDKHLSENIGPVVDLVPCKPEYAAVFRWAGGQFQLVNSSTCLSTNPKYDVLMPRGGTPLIFDTCDSLNPNQRWAIGNDAVSQGSMCVTAGWPFLQAVAVDTPSGDVALVVLNEANAEVDIGIGDSRGYSFEAFIPARSIQTYMF